MAGRRFTLNGVAFGDEQPAEASAPSPRTGWGRGSTRRWRRLRAAVLADEPRCAACLRAGRVRAATEVHHVVPLFKGGAEFDRGNVQPLCSACHRAITITARTGRVCGCDASGLPLGNHPWNASE